MAARGTEYLNRLINCMDPPKDAMIKFPGGNLTERIHGGFMKEEVIRRLFNLDNLTAGERLAVQGVADKKDELIRAINGTIRIKELEKQNIDRLKMSGSGSDPRYNGINIAYDAGTGPDKLFSNYTLVVTPATILDPATKLVAQAGMVNGLDSNSTLAPAILRNLDMSNTIRSISYIRQNKSFNIQTNIPGYENHTIETRGGGSVFLKGNPTKNKYIFDNFKDDDELPTILMYVLMKELGDTLQVLWLKQISTERGLDPSMTAILTCDKVVWLRSFVNGVSCVLRDGHSVSFYPVAGSEAAGIVAQNTIKLQLLNKLRKNNKEVIESIENFQAILAVDTTTYTDLEINEAYRAQINRILISLLRYLTPLVADIDRRAVLMQASDMPSYREFIESHMLVMPFNVNIKKYNIKHYATFKRFLPNAPAGEPKIVFRPERIYSDISAKREIDIRAVRGEIPLVGGATEGGRHIKQNKRLSKKQKGGVYPSNTDNLSSLYATNIGRPGFLSFFILTYFPELLFIGYSYLKSSNPEGAGEFDRLFEYDVGVVISEPFTSMGVNNTYDYIGDPSEDYDRLFYHLYTLASQAYHDARKKGRFVTIFDVCYEELIVFLSKNPDTGAAIENNIHDSALSLYEGLFNAEVSLNILNRREEMTPIRYFEYITAEAERPVAVAPPAAAIATLEPGTPERGRGELSINVNEYNSDNPPPAPLPAASNKPRSAGVFPLGSKPPAFRGRAPASPFSFARNRSRSRERRQGMGGRGGGRKTRKHKRK